MPFILGGDVLVCRPRAGDGCEAASYLGLDLPTSAYLHTYPLHNPLCWFWGHRRAQHLAKYRKVNVGVLEIIRSGSVSPISGFPLGLARMLGMETWRVTRSERCAGASRRRNLLADHGCHIPCRSLKSIVGRGFRPVISNLILGTTALQRTAGDQSRDCERSRLDIAAERAEGLACARASES
jgi:hypothetical protein